MTGDWSSVCLSPNVLILCCTWISSAVCLRFVVMSAVWSSPEASSLSAVRSAATKIIKGERTVKILVEKWFEHYGARKEVHSDKEYVSGVIPDGTSEYRTP